MRILHTSDWHLGRALEGRSRLKEQAQFIDELCEITTHEEIDLVLIAGDIFDTVNPAAAAEELFYESIDRLADNGRRAVVVISGNHDIPERLCASNPLAVRHGITLLGLPKEELKPNAIIRPNRVNRVAAGQGWMELSIPSSCHPVILSLLPYPSESRLNEVLANSLDETILQKEYSERIRQLFFSLGSQFRQDSVNLVLSHLFVQGGMGSDSERPIQLGSAPAVSPDVFPLGAHYVALGHLHRPQKVGGTSTPVRYSGSPLAYSFSECGYSKSVILIEAEPGNPSVIKEIPLRSGFPLVKWQAKEGLEQVYRWLEEGKDREAWIDLEIHLKDTLNPAEVQNLRRMRERIVNIRPVFPQTEAIVLEERSSLPVDELFRQFYRHKMNGAQVDEELVSLFMSLVEQSWVETPGDIEEEETA